MQVWLDGALESADAARISVLDGGLTVGTGVFETMKVVDGVPFALTRHLQRLARSAAALDIAVPSDEVLAGAWAAVIDANAAEVGERTAPADLDQRRGEVGRSLLRHRFPDDAGDGGGRSTVGTHGRGD